MANTVEIVLKALDQTRSGFNSATKNLSDFQKTAANIGKVVAGMGAAFATAAAYMIEKSIDAADELDAMSQSTGVSVEALDKLRYAAENSGASLEELSKGLRVLNRNIADAMTGASSDAATAFAAMGISVADASGKAKSADAVFAEIADRFASYEDGANKAAIANKLFGKAGESLIATLNEGADGLAKMGDEITPISTQMAKMSDEFNDNIAKIRANITGLANVAAEKLLPTLNKVAEALAGKTSSPASAAGLGLDISGFLTSPGSFLGKSLIGPLFPQDTGPGALPLPKKSTPSAPASKTEAPVLYDPKDLEKFNAEYKKLWNEQLSGSKKLEEEMKMQYDERIARIDGLKIEEQKKDDYMNKALQVYNQQWSDTITSGAALQSDLDYARMKGRLWQTGEILKSEQALNQAQLEGQRALIDTYVEQWRIAHQTIGNFASTMFGSFSSNLGGAISNIITMTESAGEAFKNLGKAMIKSVADYVGQWIAAQITLRAMQAVFGASTIATTTATAAAIGSAWSGPAALASLASFGGNAGPAIAAITSTIGFAKAASVFGGVAHGGLDYVPRESTYLLDKGERVLSPSQNEDFTAWMKGGGGSSVVEVHLDGEVLARGLGRMSGDGRLVLSAKAIS